MVDQLISSADITALQTRLSAARSWSDPAVIAALRLEIKSAHEKARGQTRLQAQELVRRADRALAVALRQGQARGEIETGNEGKARAGRHAVSSAPRLTDYASRGELFRQGVLALVDQIPSDSMFEQAMRQARREQRFAREAVLSIALEIEESMYPNIEQRRWARVRACAALKLQPEQAAQIAGLSVGDLRVGAAARDIAFTVTAASRIDLRQIIDASITDLNTGVDATEPFLTAENIRSAHLDRDELEKYIDEVKALIARLTAVRRRLRALAPVRREDTAR